MIHHVALDGIMDGALGLGLDVIDTAARLIRVGRAKTRVDARRLEQRVVSIDGADVLSVKGRRQAVDGALSLRRIRPGDVVVVPGVFAASDAAVGSLLAREDVRRVLPILARAAAKGAVVAASCSATFLLASAGLLDRQRATTTWWLRPYFARRFPRVTLDADAILVEGKRVLTAGSAFAHADLALAVVARLTSPTLARLVAQYLVLDARSSQSRYMVMDHLRSFDPALEALESFVAANLARQLSLTELARAAGTSPRTLARRVDAAVGLTPQRFVQRLRVQHAVHLLETTRLSVESIAAQVGYSDGAAFRRVFRQHVGESPRGRRGEAGA